MFARANYYIFIDKTMKEIKTIVLKKKKAFLPNLSLGKFEPLDEDNFESHSRTILWMGNVYFLNFNHTV